MAIQDFIKYLGSKVKFTHKAWHDDHLHQTVQGVISEVLIKQNLEDCEFVLNGEFYWFNSVTFIDVSLVPELS